jgi:hypothetical protein
MRTSTKGSPIARLMDRVEREPSRARRRLKRQLRRFDRCLSSLERRQRELLLLSAQAQLAGWGRASARAKGRAEAMGEAILIIRGFLQIAAHGRRA